MKRICTLFALLFTVSTQTADHPHEGIHKAIENLRTIANLDNIIESSIYSDEAVVTLSSTGDNFDLKPGDTLLTTKTGNFVVSTIGVSKSNELIITIKKKNH